MPFQLTTTKAMPGVWIQIAEYRPGRTSLWFEFLAGDMIFSPTSNLPMTEMLFRNPVPAGLFYLNKMRDGDINLRFTRDDRDLVEAAWYAWIVPGTVPTGSVVTLNWTASTSVFFPQAVADATLICDGEGGGSFDSSNVLGPTPGGGGSAKSKTTGFAIPAGSTLTINIASGVAPNPVSQPTDTWISLTGIAPVSVAEGCLAKSGQNGAAPGGTTGGAAGSAVASVGTLKFDGAKGGDVAAYNVLLGGTGGGGGGSAIDDVLATPGVDGVQGFAGPSAGGTSRGGTGGANNLMDPRSGTGTRYGGAGGCAVDPFGAIGFAPTLLSASAAMQYTEPGIYFVTTVETFDLPEQPASDDAKEESSFAVPLPKLSDEGRYHLQNLMKKLNANNQGHQNEKQDPTEYD